MQVMLVHVPKKGSRRPSMNTAPGAPSGSEKSIPRPAPAAAAVAAYSANVRPHAGDADAANHLTASIDRNAAGIYRHRGE